jgi:hypothetical protein
MTELEMAATVTVAWVSRQQTNHRKHFCEHKMEEENFCPLSQM